MINSGKAEGLEDHGFKVERASASKCCDSMSRPRITQKKIEMEICGLRIGLRASFSSCTSSSRGGQVVRAPDLKSVGPPGFKPRSDR